jgi:hypothetical protein
VTDIAFNVGDLQPGWNVTPFTQYELGEDRGTIRPGDSFEVMDACVAAKASTAWALLRRNDPDHTNAWEPFVVSSCEPTTNPAGPRFRKITPVPTPTTDLWRVMHENGTVVLNTGYLGHALGAARVAQARAGSPVFIAHYTAQKVYTIDELDSEFTGVEDYVVLRDEG